VAYSAAVIKGRLAKCDMKQGSFDGSDTYCGSLLFYTPKSLCFPGCQSLDIAYALPFSLNQFLRQKKFKSSLHAVCKSMCFWFFLFHFKQFQVVTGRRKPLERQTEPFCTIITTEKFIFKNQPN